MHLISNCYFLFVFIDFGWLYESAVVSCDVILSQRKIFLEQLFKNNAHFLDGTHRTFVEEECCVESLQSVEKRIGTAGVLVALKDKLNETFHSVLFHCLFFISLSPSLSSQRADATNMDQLTLHVIKKQEIVNASGDFEEENATLVLSENLTSQLVRVCQSNNFS